MVLNRVVKFLQFPQIKVGQSHYSFSTPTPSYEHVDLTQLNKKLSRLMRSNKLSEARKLFDSSFHRNTVTWNSMISGYVQQRRLVEARNLFDEMPHRDVVSWNVIICGYLSCRRSSWHIEEGRRLFDMMPERNSVSYNTMISSYAKMGRMNVALKYFTEAPERDVVSWNALVTGFFNNGEVERALDLFFKMPTWNSASLSTLVSGLVSNGKVDDANMILEIGKKVMGSVDLVPAYNTLIAAYGNVKRINDARNVFDMIPIGDGDERTRNGRFERNIISWNTMIMCYVEVGDIESARGLFDKMGYRDKFSWNTVINGYVLKKQMDEAVKLFESMPYPDTTTWNLIIYGITQCGEMAEALKIFDKMPFKNFVSWNIMVTGYERNGNHKEAMSFFKRMQKEGEKADYHTLSSLLCVSSNLADLHLGMQLHQLVTKTVIPDLSISNILITMYAKCGHLVEAESIFKDKEFGKDVVTWNAMIGGYAYHGHAEAALSLLKAMDGCNVKPNFITFISVLHGCAHGGMVEEGREVFQSMMSKYGMEPKTEHFGTLVDILGRQGRLEEALKLVKSMPVKPSKGVWGALLNACIIHNNAEIGAIAAEAWMEIEPANSAPYVLLGNLYSNIGKWDEASALRRRMVSNKIQKQTAFST